MRNGSGGTMSGACHVRHACREVVRGGRTLVRGPQDTSSPGAERASSSIALGCVVGLGGHLLSYEIAHEADVRVWVPLWSKMGRR